MHTERILRVRDVTNRCGISRSSVYAKAKDPADDFPAAVRISERTCDWYESDDLAWAGWYTAHGDER